MSRLFTVALRNLARQRRRTALTGASIVLGVGFAVFVTAFFNGMIDMMMRMTVESSIGAIQVHKVGYVDSDDPLKQDMPEDKAIVERIADVAGVKAVAPRLQFEGLLNNGTRASVVLGTGISPKEEYAVCPGRKNEIGADAITERTGDQMIVGGELAAALGLGKGSSATFLTPTQRGSSNALDATVRGLLTVNLPMMAKVVSIVPLDFAQELTRMRGRVTEYALAVDDLQKVDAVAAAVQQELGKEYEVQTWREREPAGAAAIGRFNVIVAIAVLVLFLLVGSSLVNSMLMSVQERVSEIGTMMSLGVRRRQVLSIVLTEATLLGFFAAIIGAMIGLAVVTWLHHRGVMFAPRGSTPLQVFPFAGVSLILKTIAGAVVGAMLAALYPAFKASRLSPVEALRTV